MGASLRPVHIVEGLKPYNVYNFTVTLCTRMGCITSLPSTGQTLPAGTTNWFIHNNYIVFFNAYSGTYAFPTMHRKSWALKN